MNSETHVFDCDRGKQRHVWRRGCGHKGILFQPPLNPAIENFQYVVSNITLHEQINKIQPTPPFLCYDNALTHSNCAWLSLWLDSERYAMCCSGEPELQACYVYQESMPKYTCYGCRNTHGLPVTKMHENARICWNISQDMFQRQGDREIEW